MPSNQPTGPIQMPPKVWLGIVAAVVIVMLALYSGTGSKTAGPARKTPQVSTASLETVDSYAKKLERQALEEQKRQAALALREASVPPGGQPQQPQSQQYQPQVTRTKRTHIFFSDRKEDPKSKELASLRSQIEDSKTALAQMLRPVPEVDQVRKPRVKAVEDEDEEPRGKGPKIDPELQQAKGKKYRLFEGTIIETVLENRLNGSFSGPVITQVTTDVYSRDHQHVLIPQGSKIIGEVQRVSGVGQQRLAVTFHRLIMPDGFSVSLDQFKGLNQIGETGLRDLVNHHYVAIFGTSIALGLVSGLAQAGGQYGYRETGTDRLRQGFSQSLSSSATTVLDRFINILPEFSVRPGHRIKVILSQDLLVPALENHEIEPDI